MLKPARRSERAVRGVAASNPAPSKEALMAMPNRENGRSESVCADPKVGNVRAARKVRNRNAKMNTKTNEECRGMRVLRFTF